MIQDLISPYQTSLPGDIIWDVNLIQTLYLCFSFVSFLSIFFSNKALEGPHKHSINTNRHTDRQTHRQTSTQKDKQTDEGVRLPDEKLKWCFISIWNLNPFMWLGKLYFHHQFNFLFSVHSLCILFYSLCVYIYVYI